MLQNGSAQSTALAKPPLPQKPPKPDLRHVTEPSERERRLATYAVLLDAWKAAKRHYDDVLYPAFRAAQLRHAADLVLA